MQKKQYKHLDKVFSLKKVERENVEPVDPYFVKPSEKVPEEESLAPGDVTISE